MTLPAPIPLCEICHVAVLKSDYEKRQHCCLDCGKEKRAIAKYKGQIVTELLGFTSAVNNRKINAPHISELAEALSAKFGGVEGFAELYYSQIMHAAGNNPGGKTALDGLRAIANIFKESTAHRESAPDKMSDEDIDRELNAILAKMLEKTIDVQALPEPETGNGPETNNS